MHKKKPTKNEIHIIAQGRDLTVVSVQELVLTALQRSVSTRDNRSSKADETLNEVAIDRFCRQIVWSLRSRADKRSLKKSAV